MQVHPALQALRGDDAPQRSAQGRLYRELGEWRAEPEMARFVDRFCGALERDPLGQVPLRHAADDFATSLQLARSGDAALLLCAVDGAALARRPVAQSASFAPSQTWERVLAGSAGIARVRLQGLRPGGADLAQADEALEPGMVSHRDGACEALVLRWVRGTLVTLKLQRRAPAGAVTREYRLVDGALLHQAAANPRDSRLELAAALLGRMGRGDAAPLLAAIADEAGGASLRWQALKACLGLDTAAGFAALCAIAARTEDPLAAPAGALRAQLIETYPQLAGIAPCPA